MLTVTITTKEGKSWVSETSASSRDGVVKFIKNNRQDITKTLNLFVPFDVGRISATDDNGFRFAGTIRTDCFAVRGMIALTAMDNKPTSQQWFELEKQSEF